MKYGGATIVLGIAGLCLLVRWEVQAQRVQEHTAALRASLAAASTQELSRRYGACVPRLSERPPQGDCAEVVRESEARALQVVKLQPPGMMFPVPVPAPKLQRVKIAVPPTPLLPEPEYHQIDPSARVIS
jgi:hypothetical protein